MGFKITEDKIGAISYTGTINLAASWITIGGQQYRTSALSVALPTLIENGLYMVYVVISAGIPTLVISQNVNSVGPAGFLAWKLVGAFYSTAHISPGLGSFVTIEGAPTSGEIVESDGSNLTARFQGFSSANLSVYIWSRIGRKFICSYRLDNVTANGVSARVPLPKANGLGGLITAVEPTQMVGSYAGQNGANNAGGGGIQALGSTDFGFGNGFSGQALSLATGTIVFGTGPTAHTGYFTCTIAQWSTTPLKDL
jgi:hypothetical protein